MLAAAAPASASPGVDAAGTADGGGSGRCSSGAPVNDTLPWAPSNSAVTAPSPIETPAKTHQTDRGSLSARPPSITMADP